MDKTDLIKAFGAFFAIMNPFVNLPVFLALTAGFTIGQQRSLAMRITLYSAVMCAIILLAGQQIISFFGITVDQFRVAGGLVLAHIAWSMLNGEAAASHHGSAAEKAAQPDLAGMAFYPITFPMLVGPGTMAAICAGGIDPAQALARNDSTPALDAGGALVMTGATGTNVADLAVLIRA